MNQGELQHVPHDLARGQTFARFQDPRVKKCHIGWQTDRLDRQMAIDGGVIIRGLILNLIRETIIAKGIGRWT